MSAKFSSEIQAYKVMGFTGATEDCLLGEDYSVGLEPRWGEGSPTAAVVCSATS